MGLPIDRLSSRLPRRFPVGAKYVVEGYGGEEGNLRVTARYVVLPGGQRINVPAGIAAGPGAQPPNFITRRWATSARRRESRSSSGSPWPPAAGRSVSTIVGANVRASV
jgi:hypothetical protein